MPYYPQNEWKMRIAIDARSSNRNRSTSLEGLSRYVLNLILGLSHLDSELEFIVFYNSSLIKKVVEKSGGPFRNRFQWVKTRSKPGDLLEHLEIPVLLRTHRIRLFHNTLTRRNLAPKVPSVVTVHELAAFDTNSQEYSKNKRMRRSLKRVFEHASFLLPVSQFIASQIKIEFAIDDQLIKTIYNSINPTYLERVNSSEIQAARERFGLENKDFYLVVASESPRKNLSLIENFAKKIEPTFYWVLTSKGENQQKIKYISSIDDLWLKALYSASQALVIPSFYEGFSLPPIEALSLGVIPVVSSNGAHIEILKDILPNELFFDPQSEKSLLKSLEALKTGGQPLKERILIQFNELKNRFSYLENAKKIHQIYREALNLK